MILFNILMLPVLVLAIMGLNSSGPDIGYIILIIWWVATVAGNIILFNQKEIMKALEEAKNDASQEDRP